jgi:hypothetical protein
MTPDTFQYALENTQILQAPTARLSTFGSSLVNYYVITENMDSLNQSRVHEGQVEAERPQIIAPMYFAKLLVDGFGERAQAYAEFISGHSAGLAFLKYGFRFKKNEIRSYEVHEPMAAVIDQVRAQVAMRDDPLAAILVGIDDAWEVSLMKFMIDFIGQSAPENMQELRKRGLLGGDIS